MRDLDILAQLRLRCDPAEERRIRRVWQRLTLGMGANDPDILQASFTPDCRLELASGERIWRGHTGLLQFYSELQCALPDLTLTPSVVVIGPQGVFEQAQIGGTHVCDWGPFIATGERITFEVLMYFWWERPAGRFGGQRIWFFSPTSDPL
jgi:hypothetical protein